MWSQVPSCVTHGYDLTPRSLSEVPQFVRFSKHEGVALVLLLLGARSRFQARLTIAERGYRVQ